MYDHCTMHSIHKYGSHVVYMESDKRTRTESLPFKCLDTRSDEVHAYLASSACADACKGDSIAFEERTASVMNSIAFVN